MHRKLLQQPKAKPLLSKGQTFRFFIEQENSFFMVRKTPDSQLPRARTRVYKRLQIRFQPKNADCIYVQPLLPLGNGVFSQKPRLTFTAQKL